MSLDIYKGLEGLLSTQQVRAKIADAFFRCVLYPESEPGEDRVSLARACRTSIYVNDVDGVLNYAVWHLSTDETDLEWFIDHLALFQKEIGANTVAVCNLNTSTDDAVF